MSFTQAEWDALFADNNSGAITPSKLRQFVDAWFAKSKFLLAGYNRVHMAGDDEGVGGLSALAGGSSQAQANTRAEALRTAMLAHMSSIGSPTLDGDHLGADLGNLATLAAIPTLTSGSDLATCITLVNGLSVALDKHATQPGVHFRDAVSSIGTPQFPLCHCSVNIIATMDGMGGVVYSKNVVNVSGGVSVGDLTFPDPSYLVIPLTLPISVDASERVVLHSFRIVSNPLAGPGPFGPNTIEIGGTGTDASIAVLLPNALSVTPLVVTMGVTFVMSVASTPLLAVTYTPPTTLPQVVTDLNDLLTDYLDHFVDFASE